jgi:hypothetical protein
LIIEAACHAAVSLSKENMRAIFLSLVLAVGPATSFATTLTGPVLDPSSGHRYYLLSQNTWSSSQIEATSLGGNLATINDAAEQAFVFERFGSFGGVQRLLWIGLTDAAQEGQFRWVSGEPVTYTNWAPGEPNSVNADEDFVAMYYPNHSAASGWNDWSNRNSDPIGLPFNGVVEVVPEPTALLCVASCSLLLNRRRHRP